MYIPVVYKWNKYQLPSLMTFLYHFITQFWENSKLITYSWLWFLLKHRETPNEVKFHKVTDPVVSMKQLSDMEKKNKQSIIKSNSLPLF